jgi:hypothetical protein
MEIIAFPPAKVKLEFARIYGYNSYRVGMNGDFIELVCYDGTDGPEGVLTVTHLTHQVL